ncbi:unnamed protein product [Vicia faba]|uniref:Uncharacterized protein n=1 Tax=Vicia faba TaxID=3906 RepID=A0AAV0ZJK4_VICFA|nr:unnamed protein product [Vicia faba]
MIKGKQLSMIQREYLTSRVTVAEIDKALQDIGDLKAPSADGFGAKFFKSCWHFIQADVLASVMEFFEKNRIFSPFNKIVITLIPKHDQAKGVREDSACQKHSFAITQFWLQCLPLPKFVLKKIDALCKSFIWNGTHEISRKSPVAWKKFCSPMNQGGLNVINLAVWNKVTMLKCL